MTSWFPGILLGGHYDGPLLVPSSGSMCGGGRVQQLFRGGCKLSESPSCSQRACLLPVPLCGNVGGLLRNVTHVDTVLSFMKETHGNTYGCLLLLPMGLTPVRPRAAGKKNGSGRAPHPSALPHPMLSSKEVQLTSFSVLEWMSFSRVSPGRTVFLGSVFLRL